MLMQLRWEEIQRTLVRQLGKGSFGHVFEGWYHSAPMAVKVMNVDCCTGKQLMYCITLYAVCMITAPLHSVHIACAVDVGGGVQAMQVYNSQAEQLLLQLSALSR